MINLYLYVFIGEGKKGEGRWVDKIKWWYASQVKLGPYKITSHATVYTTSSAAAPCDFWSTD